MCSVVGGDILEAHIITLQQDKMIDMLVAGENIAEIARRLNVARSTIYDWKSKPVIIAELEQRRADLKKTAQNKIVSDVSTCIDNMYAMANQKTDQRVRYQANKFIIEMALGKASNTVQNNNAADKTENNDTNKLKDEIEDIKNIRAIK